MYRKGVIKWIEPGELWLKSASEVDARQQGFYNIQDGQGISIVDAGGGTLDISAYACEPDGKKFEEIAEAQCKQVNCLLQVLDTNSVVSRSFQGLYIRNTGCGGYLQSK